MLFPHILGIIIPTDELILFRGVGIPPTSIQLNIRKLDTDLHVVSGIETLADNRLARCDRSKRLAQ